MALTPIFLISLPRSGSTFLQKILMSHPDIASTAEPWFLLPLCYMRKKEDVFARYGHIQSVNAMNRISEELTQPLTDRLIAEFTLAIYQSYCKKNESYFLDKTPRYYYIVDDLIRIFPKAKFIVLLRDPLSVFASSIEAFQNNSMRRLDHLDGDFKQGPERIGRFAEKHRGVIHLINYEKLVADPQREIERICRYLHVDYFDGMIEQSFDIGLEGHGDRLGARKYKEVVNHSETWQRFITTRYRKLRLLRYLKQYPELYLRIGNYSRKILIERVKQCKLSSVGLSEYLMLAEELVARGYKYPFRNHYG